MADASRSDIFTLVRKDPERLLSELAETIGAVVGETCSLAVEDAAGSPPAFSNARCWTIPWSGSGDAAPRGLIALDTPAFIRAAGALAMMPAEGLAAALASGDVHEKVAASLPGLGNLLVGALGKLCDGTGAVELTTGDANDVEAGPWPALVSAFGESAALVSARLTVGEQTDAGSILVLSCPADESGGGANGNGDRADDARIVDLDGMTVRMFGRPGDPAQVALGDVVESLGGRVLPMHQTSLLADPPAAAFVVSRSPSDLRARMETLSADDERPPLIVACSDRPTRDLVLSARQAGADDFLVLPTTRERLIAVLAKAMQPA